MSADQLFIGIDSGTQGTKAIVLSRETRKILAESNAHYPLIENDQGKREQKPQWWVKACTKVLAEVLQHPDINPHHIKAIGVSGQQHGMVPLDKKGDVIRPAKLWCDTETTTQCEVITQKLGGTAKVIEAIGNTIAAGFTASKILWLKQNEPLNYRSLASVLLPHDYLNYWLTGSIVTECGDASGTAYFDVKNRCWSTAVLDAIDDTGKLQACLPKLITSQTPAGKIQPSIAEQFNLCSDVLVASGGGDNMMAAIGTGNVIPGIVTASLGTSGTIFACSDKPVIDPKGELAAFCSSSNKWLPLVCTMNVTVTTEQIRQLLQLDVLELNQKAASAPIGSDGIVMLPYFQGERTPALPNAKAVIWGLNNTNMTSANLCRAAMEGATFGLGYGLNVLKSHGIYPDELRLVGGGSKSALWRQIVADLFNCPVVCPETTEAGALGAAIQAMWCYLNEKEGGADLKTLTTHYVSLDRSTCTDPQAFSVKYYQELFQQYMYLNDILKPSFTD